MRIGIQTWGSHGDVAPTVALGAGLSAAGPDVTLEVASDGSVDYTTAAKAANIKLRLTDTTRAEPPAAVLRQIGNTMDPLKELRLLNQHYFDPFEAELFNASKRLCEENELVIGHFWIHTLLAASQLTNTPRVALHFCPIGVRSRTMPASGPDLGPWLNGLVWNIGDRLITRQLLTSANTLRAREGLPPITSAQRDLFISADLTMIAASPVLFERPPDWGKHIVVPGHFSTHGSARRGQFDAQLRAFVEAGEPPIFMSFGSCDRFYGADNLSLFLKTVEASGLRAIVQTETVPNKDTLDMQQVRVVRECDHGQVFPHCRLIVHHGGAGTTHSSLAAGRPAVIVAHGFDQYFWGRVAARRGFAAAPLVRRSVSPRQLAKAVTRVARDSTMTEVTKQAGRQLAQENGVETAVRLITESFAG